MQRVFAAAGDGLVLGVDGGNTKTLAVVADGDGRVIAVGRGGCTDVHAVNGPDAACAELSRTVEVALRAASCVSSDLDAAVFSLAGADWPEDRERLHQHLTASFEFGADPVIVNDAIGGLRSGAPDWEGIALICGTGNAVGARHRDGSVFSLGFWPDTIGAVVLSGFALDAVQRDHLGLGPRTSLTGRALALYGASDPIDLLHRFTRVDGALGQADQVKMSPVLFDEADQGDEVALDLVVTAGTALGAQGRMAAERVGLDVPGTLVVMAGGLFRHPTKLLEDAVMAELPGGVATRTSRRPVIGPLLIALDRLGRPCDPDAVHRSLELLIDPGTASC